MAVWALMIKPTWLEAGPGPGGSSLILKGNNIVQPRFQGVSLKSTSPNECFQKSFSCN